MHYAAISMQRPAQSRKITTSLVHFYYDHLITLVLNRQIICSFVDEKTAENLDSATIVTTGIPDNIPSTLHPSREKVEHINAAKLKYLWDCLSSLLLSATSYPPPSIRPPFVQYMPNRPLLPMVQYNKGKRPR